MSIHASVRPSANGSFWTCVLGAVAALTVVACSATVQRSADETEDARADPSAAQGGSGTGGTGGVGDADGSPDAPVDGCDDGDPCTLDEHPPGYCVHTWICGGQGGAGGGEDGHAG